MAADPAPSPAWPSPLLPGFHPDPSIVSVDGTYYLITSTFEYLPGVPIFRSSDLVTWTPIGHVVTRDEQVGLGGVMTPGGVWAPTIRFRGGIFYVIVSVMLGGRGCVVFTATDPAGPWSDGVPIPAVDGIDPDLAWDDDGTAYVTYARHPDAIQQVRVDLATGAALESPRALWAGSGLYSPEGPHLYHRGDDWYLLVAEGGTDRGHVVSVARGPAPSGPFAGYPANPVLSARSTGRAVQNVGHADLIDLPDGRTIAVALGVRPVGLAQAFSPLGRETFATVVDWVDGWPVPRPVDHAPSAAVEDFSIHFADLMALDDPEWIAVRRPPAAIASIQQGQLSIAGRGVDLDDRHPDFLGRRQRHLNATVTAVLDVSRGAGGLAARYAEDNFFALHARGDGATTVITARAVVAGLERSWELRTAPGPVELQLEMTAPAADFGAGMVGGDRIRLRATCAGESFQLAELDGRHWCFETAKTFTGRVIGLYATQGTVTVARWSYRGTDRGLGATEPDRRGHR